MNEVPTPPAAPTSDEGLVRAIGVRQLAANVVNMTVGAGIFVLPATVAAALGPAALLAFVVCGTVMGLVLLCFAEAGSRVTRSGGSYAYVEAAFGPYAGFLVGTLQWFVLGMLSNAAIAVVLVEMAARTFPALDGPVARVLLLGGLYAGLAWLNVRGVRQGARFATAATVAKLLPLLLLVVVGLPAVEPSNLAGAGWPSADQIASTALVLFFAFAGPESALTASGEIRRPERVVPRGVLLGAGGVLALYLALQVVAQGVLGPALPAEREAPLAAAAGRVLGPWGAALLLGGAALSIFGTISGDLLANPRALFASARDGFFVPALARVHPRFRTPHVAIAAYALLAFGFAASGAFETLASVASVGLLLVYLSACLATLQLRRKGVRAEGEPFRLPGGPAIPLLAAGVVVWVLAHVTLREVVSLGLLLAVASGFYLVRRQAAEPGRGAL